MSLRIHALGFPSDWSPATRDALAGLAKEAKASIECKAGVYRIWRSRTGAELAFHFVHPRRADGTRGRADLDRFVDAVALTPFHAGTSSLDVRVQTILAGDRSSPMEGSCILQFVNGEGRRYRTALVVEMTPFLEQAPLARSAQTACRRMQVICFAHALWAFPDAESYRVSVPAHRRLMPGGFTAIGEDEVREVALTYADRVVSLALVTGVVERSVRYINPVTGDPYLWLALRFRAGVMDVCVNPKVIDGDISEGHIAQVCGSMVGRFHTPGGEQRSGRGTGSVRRRS